MHATALSGDANLDDSVIAKGINLPWMSDGVKSGLASGMATALVKTILQPFDTIKVGHITCMILMYLVAQ